MLTNLEDLLTVVEKLPQIWHNVPVLKANFSVVSFMTYFKYFNLETSVQLAS